jgi:hypothetical protein
MLHVRPARPEDARDLAPRLRPADVREIRALRGEEPSRVLEEGLAWSTACFAAEDDAGLLVALFGAGPDGGQDAAGLIWLLASPELERNGRDFLRQCRHWVDRLHEHCPRLGNVVDARNDVHLRWLAWCGFTVVRRLEGHGVERRTFLEVRRCREGSADEGGRFRPAGGRRHVLSR